MKILLLEKVEEEASEVNKQAQQVKRIKKYHESDLSWQYPSISVVFVLFYIFYRRIFMQSLLDPSDAVHQ